MTIILNGEKRGFDCPMPLPSLLEKLGLAGRPVVVEHNQSALLPREIESALVADGDVIEIVQITAGG
ncbi:MAG TPA: thiamine biosynthesis protein ThiS [Verrucomicrobiales bacterium]|nr:thiamine biosynthesis protein ThiS [Verrucomicrobiales bacterium]